MASDKRLEIIDLLSEGEKSVGELTRAMGVPKANASQHLALLRGANLVIARKEGQHVYYRLANAKIFQAWALIRELAFEQLTVMEELRRALREQERAKGAGIEELTLAELVRQLDRGEVVLLDVRPAEEYEKGHIQGALSLPLEEINQRWKELPQDQELVAYCRGPYCVLSDRAVQKLREHEIKARKLSVGYPEWKQAGFPVEKGALP